MIDLAKKLAEFNIKFAAMNIVKHTLVALIIFFPCVLLCTLFFIYELGKHIILKIKEIFNK